MNTPSTFLTVNRFVPCFAKVMLGFVVMFYCATWEVQAQSGGAVWRYLGPDGANVTHIAASGDTLYAATENGAVFRSVDGTSWLPLNSLRTSARSISASTGGVLVAYRLETFSDVAFRGTTFTTFTTGNPISQDITDHSYETPHQIALNASNLIAINQEGISIGTLPNLRNFSRIFTSATVTCIASVDNVIYAGTKREQLLYSNNLGRTWFGISLPFEPTALTLTSRSTLFASSTNAIYFSYDRGLYWKQMGKSPRNTILQGLTFARGRLYAATNGGAYFSADSGQTWQNVNAGLTEQGINKIIANDSAVFVNIYNPNNRSIRTYQFVSPNFIPFQIGQDTLPPLQATQDFFFVVSDSILLRSRNGKDWIPLGKLPNNIGFGYIAAYDNNRTYYAATSDGIYRSLDSGKTWKSEWLKGESVYNFGITNDTIHAFTAQAMTSLSSSLYYSYPIKTSVDNGKSWQQISNVSRNDPVAISRVILFRNSLYVITRGGGCCTYYHSILNVPPPILYRLRGYGFLQDYVKGIISGWEPLAPNIIGLASRRNEILQIPDNRIIVSSGLMIEPFYKSILTSKPILGSSDGQRWTAYTTNGLTNTDFTSLAANNKSIFVGTSGGLYVLDAPTTSVSVGEAPVFSPEWLINPQPASNTLTLNFMLPTPAHVRCTLHTVLGQEIATLADNAYASGQHDITAAIPSMASGLYICRLVVDGRVVGSKSIILAR